MTDYTDQILRTVAHFEQLSKERKERGSTPEEAQERLQNAGILDENGEFTKPYENLGRWCKENSIKK